MAKTAPTQPMQGVRNEKGILHFTLFPFGFCFVRLPRKSCQTIVCMLLASASKSRVAQYNGQLSSVKLEFFGRILRDC